MKYSKEEVEQAEVVLRDIIKPGQRVYTILRRVSRSGMMRHVSVIIMEDGAPRDITHLVSRALEMSLAPHGGVKVGGCGFDAGFHVVYDIGYVLFSDGFTCLGKSCPSNDHSNGDRNYRRHHHKDGGYSLKHEWM